MKYQHTTLLERQEASLNRAENSLTDELSADCGDFLIQTIEVELYQPDLTRLFEDQELLRLNNNHTESLIKQ